MKTRTGSKKGDAISKVILLESFRIPSRWMWGEEFRTDGLIVNVSHSAHSSQWPPCLRLVERLVKDFLWEEFVRCMGIGPAVSTRWKKDRLGTTTGLPLVLREESVLTLGREVESL